MNRRCSYILNCIEKEPCLQELNDRSLLSALQAYRREKVYGFHTPGHGQGRGMNVDLLNPTLDLTEVQGLDDLHAPEGCIAASLERAAQIFNASRSFYLVQGATVGLQAFCLAALKPGQRLVLPRHIHRSVISGLILSGAVPVYLPSVCEAETGLPLAVSWDSVDFGNNRINNISNRINDGDHEVYLNIKNEANALSGETADVCLALSPTYWGTCDKLEKWVELANDRLLFIDEAHGAAFSFYKGFPAPALSFSGVNGVVHGTHKTLPALTQAGMLHISKNSVNEAAFSAGIGQALTLLQTTSPSYLLLASLEWAQSVMAERGSELWENVFYRVSSLRKKLQAIKGIHCWGEEILGYQDVGGWDPTKLLVTWDAAIDGSKVRQWLRRQFKIEAELAGARHLLFLLSPFDRPEADAVLESALRALSEELKESKEQRQKINWQSLFNRIPPMLLTPREAFYADKCYVPLKEAKGRIAGESICPYPPGIPLLNPGERVTEEIMEKLLLLKRLGTHWQGSADSRLDKIAVVCA